MREIKFRAWDKEHKEWIIDIDSFFNGMLFDRKIGSVGIDFWSTKFELMQYTGLKDKNGKEIYEGDIIEIDWNDKMYPKHISKNFVAWNENDACWDLPEGGSPKNDANRHYKVIGNIHENPELLEVIK